MDIALEDCVLTQYMYVFRYCHPHLFLYFLSKDGDDSIETHTCAPRGLCLECDTHTYGLCLECACVPVCLYTGWRRLIGSPKLQIISHKRATKFRSLLRNMTYKDKGSYESSPPCISVSVWLCICASVCVCVCVYVCVRGNEMEYVHACLCLWLCLYLCLCVCVCVYVC